MQSPKLPVTTERIAYSKKISAAQTIHPFLSALWTLPVLTNAVLDANDDNCPSGTSQCHKCGHHCIHLSEVLGEYFGASKVQHQREVTAVVQGHLNAAFAIISIKKSSGIYKSCPDNMDDGTDESFQCFGNWL